MKLINKLSNAVKERLDTPLMSRRRFVQGLIVSALLLGDQGEHTIISGEGGIQMEQQLSSEEELLKREIEENYEILRPKDPTYTNNQMFIDYSHHQGGNRGIDPYKQQLSPWFFITKSTDTEMSYGNGVDDSFATLRKNITDRPIGGYMWLNWHKDNIQEQCDLYISNTPLKTGDFRPIIDVEKIGVRHITHRNYQEILVKLNNAIGILKNHYGVSPIIYTSEKIYLDFFKDNLDEDLPYRIANYNGRIDSDVANDVDMRQISQYSKALIYKDGRRRDGSKIRTQKNTDINVILDDSKIYMP